MTAEEPAGGEPAGEEPPAEETVPEGTGADAGASRPEEAPPSGFDHVLRALGGGPIHVSYNNAAHGNINTGSVHGGQAVGDGPAGDRRRATRVHEGPIPQAEVDAAAFGFVEPDAFRTCLGRLRDDGLLFLSGRPGSGRRTTALNLLRRHCGEDAALRALDSVTELDRWRPDDPDARGYLLDGLFPTRPLGPGVLGNLRDLLARAGACMVLILPDDDPQLLRTLERDLHISPVPYEPPPPVAVFHQRLAAEVVEEPERSRLLGAVEPGLLDELLVPGVVPHEAVELVSFVVAADGERAALGDVRERLSYRAEERVPPLVDALRDDADGLAFLLSVAVFEGLDHRVVREEAERLLELSEGRLASVLEPTEEGKEPRPNPQFVFRRPLRELLRSVGGRREPREIRAAGGFSSAVEPVVFVRQGQREAVLRHVWREYGQLSELLVTWLREVDGRDELTEPVARMMGQAASWGGGRSALRHIAHLAASERMTGRLIAARALGIAAEDPVLVTEVRHRLGVWAWGRDRNRRATVAYACGSEFGLGRPERALRLLGTLLRGVHSDIPEETGVLMAVQSALVRLHQAGHEQRVLDQLASWSADMAPDAGPLLSVLPRLLAEPRWFQSELAEQTARAPVIVALIRAALNSADAFEAVCREVLRWCETARWEPTAAAAVEQLLTALADPMEYGTLRLFVEIERSDPQVATGRGIALRALRDWRTGASRTRPGPGPGPSASTGSEAA
ncbi:hypothetical protein [Streptomyces sp. NPDC047097]|uniref:nSTAND3 domain-containing NTPase n=1 Tax=Streptomyces sp. NPDC047097 TaxID=3155260 RepID=UPI0033D0B35E